MASEESEDIIPIPDEYPLGKYVVIFDPLDGSSNIDVNVSVGTIFSVYHRITPEGRPGRVEDCLQPGIKQICAGYVVYGSSTMLVYTTGNGVYGFTLDPSYGEFVLSHPNIRIPKKGKIYSLNESYYAFWDEPVKQYVQYIKQVDGDSNRPMNSRYIGSLVSDFHRNLLYGGIFLYPPSKKRQKANCDYFTKLILWLSSRSRLVAEPLMVKSEFWKLFQPNYTSAHHCTLAQQMTSRYWRNF